MASAQSESQSVPDRTSFTARDSVEYIWKHLGLPAESLDALDLKGSGPGLPSSFKIADLAQASVGLSALLAAQIYALRTASPVPTVTGNPPKTSGAPSAASTKPPTAMSASTTASPTTATARKPSCAAHHPPTARPSAPPSPPGAPSTSKLPPSTPAASSPP
ncbi:hypothetical protein CNMCM8714_005112 [Aspergillus fumigatus]|nr:hypothetical protein CNMCM8714_005112 [Aspergillus fumigatus]